MRAVMHPVRGQDQGTACLRVVAGETSTPAVEGEVPDVNQMVKVGLLGRLGPVLGKPDVDLEVGRLDEVRLFVAAENGVVQAGEVGLVSELPDVRKVTIGGVAEVEGVAHRPKRRDLQTLLLLSGGGVEEIDEGSEGVVAGIIM